MKCGPSYCTEHQGQHITYYTVYGHNGYVNRTQLENILKQRNNLNGAQFFGQTIAYNITFTHGHGPINASPLS